jgi:hypothetical protein
VTLTVDLGGATLATVVLNGSTTGARMSKPTGYVATQFGAIRPGGTSVGWKVPRPDEALLPARADAAWVVSR